MTGVHEGVEYCALVRARQGYRQAGDAAVIVAYDGMLLLAIVDVLGHGPEAHDVAMKAKDFLENSVASDDPREQLAGLHATLKGTRGAAVGLCILDAASGLLRYVGIGNTVIRRFGEQSDRLLSGDGIVGGNMRTPREQRMMLRSGDTVLMYSDGVSDHFELREYPQLPIQNSEMIARTLIQRFGKDYDDASCIVARYKP